MESSHYNPVSEESICVMENKSIDEIQFLNRWPKVILLIEGLAGVSRNFNSIE